MNGVILNIYADISEQDYWKEELVNYRRLPVAWEIIERDDMIRMQLNVSAVEFNMVDLEIIVFNNGDWEDILASHKHFDHISIVASNKY